MILVDTSAWVEFLRGTGSAVHMRVRDLVSSSVAIATTDVVLMELLAGAKSEASAQDLRRMLLGFKHLRGHALDDAEHAAALYRQCRRAGATVRSLNDCLIAAVAIRAHASVLHCDRDFDAIATHAGLSVVNV